MINPSDFDRLISDFGQQLTVTKVTTDGSYDPSTGTVTGSSTRNYTFTGYFYSDTEGPTSASKTTKTVRNLAVSSVGLQFVPEDGDSISGYGEISSVRTIDSRGNPVVYLCEVHI